MKIYRYPDRKQWTEITTRPETDLSQLNDTVGRILADVRRDGDEAVKAYEEKFDRARLSSLQASEKETDEAEASLDPALKEALRQAHANISRFHEAQRQETRKVETCKGVVCWQKSVPIERAGLYVPGGTAPLFSTVLMLATPAKIAGCKEIIMCTPPDADGHIHPAILVAARIAGVGKIFKAGGVQAIGAMAYGTQSVPKADKIFGPGNRYVMAAKQQVSLRDAAIDMPAGPSEVCVVADETSDASFVAADLLSQAEHGADSQVLFITVSEALLSAVREETEKQLSELPRRETARKAMDNSSFVLVKDSDEAIALSNAYAPEHLIICTSDYERLQHRVTNAGSVFLGNYACESAGDYASGTNHTLPTHGYARAYSGVNLDAYIRKITFQHITADGIRSIGRTVELMAANEQLDGHRRAMTKRIESAARLAEQRNEKISMKNNKENDERT